MEANGKPIVFITNFAAHDHEKAKFYGTLRYVTKGYVNFQKLDRLKFIVAQALIDSKPDDYILLSGTTLVSVICGLFMLQKHGVVNILTHDRKTDTYRLLKYEKSAMDTLLTMIGEGNVPNQEAD